MASNVPKVMSHEQYTGGTAILQIDPKQEQINIHKANLRKSSPFFANLYKYLLDSNDTEILLPDMEWRLITEYIVWIYSDPVTTPRFSGNAFCDAAISALISQMDQANMQGKHLYPGPPHVRKIYEGTQTGSPIGKFLTQVYYVQATTEEFRPNAHGFLRLISQQEDLRDDIWTKHHKH